MLWISSGLIALAALALVATRSRGGAFAAMAGLLAIAWAHEARTRRWIVGMGAVLFAGMLVWRGVAMPERMAIWKAALTVAGGCDFQGSSGYDPPSFVSAWGMPYPSPYLALSLLSDPLHFLVQYGWRALVGIALAVTIMSAALRFGSIREQPGLFSCGVAALIVAIAGSFTSHVSAEHGIQWLIPLALCAVGVGMAGQRPRAWLVPISAGVVTALALALLAWGVARTSGTKLHRESRSGNESWLVRQVDDQHALRVQCLELSDEFIHGILRPLHATLEIPLFVGVPASPDADTVVIMSSQKAGPILEHWAPSGPRRLLVVGSYTAPDLLAARLLTMNPGRIHLLTAGDVMSQDFSRTMQRKLAGSGWICTSGIAGRFDVAEDLAAAKTSVNTWLRSCMKDSSLHD